MAVIKGFSLFLSGGSGYILLEFLWRGRSHVSMFFAGGVCFLLLGQLDKLHIPIIMKVFLGAAVITAVELLTGLLVNQQYQVWDYRHLPYNFRGQICLRYFLLWIPVSILAMVLYRWLCEKFNAILL